MTYHFKGTQTIELSGDIEADTEDEARDIASNIMAGITSDGKIEFINMDDIDYPETALNTFEIDDIYEV